MKRERVVRRFFGIFGVAVILIWGACSFLQEIWEPQDVVAVLGKTATPPTINITHPTNGQEVGTLYELKGNFVKGGLEVEYVFYSTDGKSFNNVSFSGTKWSVVIVLDEDDLGKHTNYVYAVDQAGNKSSVEKVWVEQTDIPGIVITSHTNIPFVNERNITVSGTAGIRFPYTVTNVKVKVDDGDWVAGSVNGTNWSADIMLNENEGANTIRAMAFADSGKSNVSAETIINLDTTPPTIEITNINDGDSVGMDYTLAGTVVDTASGVSSVHYRVGEIGDFSSANLDGSNWTADITLPGFGSYTNYVYAVDKAGNTSETNTVWVLCLDKIYVSTNGNDTDFGSKENPLKTIQTAINKAGDLGINDIYVESGIYTPDDGLNTNNAVYQHSGAYINIAGLTIFGGWDADFTERNGMSELDGASALKHVIWIDNVANVTIDGFVIRGGNANGDAPHNRGGGVYINEGSGHLITNAVISNNTATKGGGVYVNEGTSHTISGKILSNTANLGGGVCFYDTSPNDTHSFDNAIIYGNSDYGMAIVNINSNPQGIGTIIWGSGNTPRNNNRNYVSATGDDDNEGTKDSPFKSIQKAVSIVSENHHIFVAEGIYTPGSGLNTDNASYSNSGAFIANANFNILGGWDTDFTERNGISELDGESSLKHVIWIDNVANITIDGFVIRGGNANETSSPHSLGGGVYINAGSGHKIQNAVISDNTAVNGGGVYVTNGTSHTISATITDNTANNHGGGVFVTGGAYHTISGTIYGNKSTSGSSYGGGVYVHTGTNHTISGTISGNTANDRGGGVSVYQGSSHTISATITSNTANNYGGGVYVIEGTSHTISATITSNTANNGGGVYMTGGTGNTISGTITGNTATTGGGVRMEGGGSHTISATITSNTANNGGGVHVYQGAGHTISATITGNSANTTGGGVFVYQGAGHAISATITGNTANNNGGGVYFVDTPPANNTHRFVAPVAISNNSQYGVARSTANSDPQGLDTINWGSGNTPLNVAWLD
jgi:hypothetical protein